MQYKLNEKTKSTSTSEQFQNPIEKILETEAKWIPLKHIYNSSIDF